MSWLDGLYGESAGPPARPEARIDDRRWTAGGGIEVSLFVGEIVDAPVEAVCTSTNPRLSLGGGTGRAMLEETGWGLKRRLETVLEREAERTGERELPVGFTCATPGGRPPHRLIVHCVASDAAHRSSASVVGRCTEGALREADAAGCASLAMPVFGTGHADVPFEDALRALASALRDASTDSVREVLVVILQPDRIAAARKVLDGVLTAR